MDLPKNGVCVANALRARHDALASPIYSLAKEASVCLLCSLNVHGQLRPRWWRAALKLFWPYHFHASLIFAERSISLFLPSCKTRRLVLLLNFALSGGVEEHVAGLKKKNEAFFIEKVFLFFIKLIFKVLKAFFWLI